jgi:transposase
MIGRVDEHHRQLLRHLLDHIAFLEAEVDKLEAEIEQRLAPYQEQMDLLSQIVGLLPIMVAAILGEIGVDRTCFPA